MKGKPIRRLLVANRGECAARILRTARRMGVWSAAVCALDDRGAAHCERADAVFDVDSYLNPAAIVEAALRACADAIHPGWGFLSERPALARAAARAGVIFVGPSESALRRAGDKAAAKALAEKAGVPVLPGVAEARAGADDAALLQAARRIGFPVLIKAAAGGGGRGMRAVEDGKSFSEALAAARREARSGFGSAAVIVEKHVPRARHVEAQFFGDASGGVQVLGLRDCSLQRRRQKIVEEAPPPHLSPKTAAALEDAALRLALALKYCGAGTAEFLIGPDGSWHFLEINARLQVEHALTEELFGIDLVEWQLRAAAGESLPERGAPEGFAAEARVCAEDPLNDFLPAPGDLSCAFPDGMTGVRVDSAGDGPEATGRYDSMVAKIIASGGARAEALQRLSDALAVSRVAGASNAAFLRLLLADPDVAAGRAWTTLIEDKSDALRNGMLRQRLRMHALAAAHALSGFGAPFPAAGLRLHAPPEARFLISDAHGSSEARAQMRPDGSCMVKVGGERMEVGGLAAGEEEPGDGIWQAFRVRIGGEPARAHYREREEGSEWILDGMHLSLKFGPDLRRAAESAGAGECRSPMRAVVQKCLVAQGSAVKEGAPVVALEAMKMEAVARAPCAGVVLRMRCAPGDAVEQGDLLAEIGDAPAATKRRR